MIGVDPAKRSLARAVLDEREQQLAALQVVNDSAGHRDLLRLAKWPHRTWAVEGAGGVGVQLAQRLVADGETAIDVPPKLATRARTACRPPWPWRCSWDSPLPSLRSFGTTRAAVKSRDPSGASAGASLR
jgi:hypothetical protein